MSCLSVKDRDVLRFTVPPTARDVASRVRLLTTSTGQRMLERGQMTVGENTLTAPPPKGGGFLAHAAWPSSGRPGLTRSAPAGFRPARMSITRAEFLSLGETAPHAVQV